MEYSHYRYIYPTRPANAVPPSDLDFWQSQDMLGQLKFNGSNCVLFTNGEQLRAMNRHNGLLTGFNISKEEIIETLYKPLRLNNKWIVLNGEYLNKSKLDENSNSFNHKLILFDVLVYDSNYLIGKSFGERVTLLDNVYGQKDSSSKEYLYGISENIYRVQSFTTNFKEAFDTYTKINLIEGLVLKRKNAKLEVSTSEKNNWRSQIKCRKAEKNYKY